MVRVNKEFHTEMIEMQKNAWSILTFFDLTFAEKNECSGFLNIKKMQKRDFEDVILFSYFV